MSESSEQADIDAIAEDIVKRFAAEMDNLPVSEVMKVVTSLFLAFLTMAPNAAERRWGRDLSDHVVDLALAHRYPDEPPRNSGLPN